MLREFVRSLGIESRLLRDELNLRGERSERNREARNRNTERPKKVTANDGINSRGSIHKLKSVLELRTVAPCKKDFDGAET